jgi:parvulin-like peptidyl-prolyl isomerase
MDFWMKAVALACVAQCVLLMTVLGVNAEIIDRVLAVVDGVVITLSDVAAASALGLVPEDNSDDDRTGAVLARLINRQLILGEVDRYAPAEPSNESIEQALQSIRSRFASTDAYNVALTRLGLDDKRLRQTVRDSFRIRAYLEQRFAVPPPGDEELRRYYREHFQEFTKDGQTASFESARAQIEDILVTARREMLVDEWVNGLRRRADINNVYLSRR